jgi:hypothetical protein
VRILKDISYKGYYEGISWGQVNGNDEALSKNEVAASLPDF